MTSSSPTRINSFRCTAESFRTRSEEQFSKIVGVVTIIYRSPAQLPAAAALCLEEDGLWVGMARWTRTGPCTFKKGKAFVPLSGRKEMCDRKPQDVSIPRAKVCGVSVTYKTFRKGSRSQFSFLQKISPVPEFYHEILVSHTSMLFIKFITCTRVCVYCAYYNA